MPVRILTRSDVSRLLTLSDCISLQETAFRWLAEGKAYVSENLWLRMPEFGGWFKLLSGCVVPEAVAGVKALSRNPRLPSGGNLSGLLLLYDARENRLLSIMDAAVITAIRTGAGGGLAARFLARRDAEAVGILGSGVQARVNLEAVALECPSLRRARVYSRDPGHREAFAREMSAQTGLSVESVGDPEAALTGADVIITATNSPRPVLRREWVHPGACVLLMGIKSEVDPACFPGAKIVVDGMEVARADGKIAEALAGGVIRPEDVYAELAELVVGSKPGRTTADEIIYFDSSGVAVQDIACAAYCYRKAEELGMGTVVDLEDGEA